MRLLVGMKVWWQSDWIEYALKSVYAVADGIRIAYGPTKKLYAVGFKPDDTLDKLRNFPDPESKIDIGVRTFWENTAEMAQWTMDERYDYYLKLDGDEVLSPEWLKEFYSLTTESMKQHKVITTCSTQFCGDFGHIMTFPKHDEWRFRGTPIANGIYFRHHPDFLDGIFEKIDKPQIKMEHEIHHYNRLRDQNAIFVHAAYQLVTWHNWIPQRILGLRKTGSSRFLNFDALKQEWKIYKVDTKHPDIVKNHPYYPYGPPTWKRVVRWKDLI